MKDSLKKLIVAVVPLFLRKRLAIWVNRCRWLDSSDRAYWATQLLTDFAEREVNEYHKFLWAHHLAYAETYEVHLRFGYENLNETRKLFFAELPKRIAQAGAGSVNDTLSVLEVGCSLGYLLRYMETDVFPNATRIEGIDIDGHAIDEGMRHLETLDSKVVLRQGDMVEMSRIYGDTKFDLVLGSGVLLYLDEANATEFVAVMLRSAGKMLAITALAHPDSDNRELEHSVPRDRDGTWIHNVDRMVELAGGHITGRRWEGSDMIDGNTIYFVYAVQGRAGQ